MNISSAIIKTAPKKEDVVLEQLTNSGLCEIHQVENNKFVITIEGKDISEEVSKLRAIEKLNHILSAELVYSYSEDELEQERNKIELSDSVPQWLNDENLNAKDIRYNGNLKKKF